MKLAAIYNVWDGLELLPHSLRSIRSQVDCIIVVWQGRSNWGEYDSRVGWAVEALGAEGLIDHAASGKQASTPQSS